MAKVIVTGSSGFVGKHLIELLKRDKRVRVFPLDFKQADITDYSQVKKYLTKIRPDQVYHLAGFASGAGKNKELIFKVNVDGTLNILKALKNIGKPVKILLASTAYVYGNTARCASEKSPIDAKSFYDKSKIEMEQKVLANYSSSGAKRSREVAADSSRYARTVTNNLQIVITRASNHTGLGQRLGFVVPDFCEQIAKAKDGDIISVGNLSAKRDFFDVRDCIRAYKIVMQKGQSGEVYNIGTGRAISIKEILEKLIKISGKKISYKIDPKRMRASDIAKNCVDASKVKKLGWEARIPLEKTFIDTYNFFKRYRND